MHTFTIATCILTCMYSIHTRLVTTAAVLGSLLASVFPSLFASNLLTLQLCALTSPATELTLVFLIEYSLTFLLLHRAF
jgi:hypothetical protein